LLLLLRVGVWLGQAARYNGLLLLQEIEECARGITSCSACWRG
jgi:hypothetical protein